MTSSLEDKIICIHACICVGMVLGTSRTSLDNIIVSMHALMCAVCTGASPAESVKRPAGVWHIRDLGHSNPGHGHRGRALQQALWL